MGRVTNGIRAGRIPIGMNTDDLERRIKGQAQVIVRLRAERANKDSIDDAYIYVDFNGARGSN